MLVFRVILSTKWMMPNLQNKFLEKQGAKSQTTSDVFLLLMTKFTFSQFLKQIIWKRDTKSD